MSRFVETCLGHVFYYDTAFSYLLSINTTDRKVLVAPELDVETQLELWLKEKKRAVDVNELSLSYYRCIDGFVRNHFADYFANQHVLMIDSNALQMFKDTLTKQKIKTRKNIMGALHNFMLWLLRSEKIDRMPLFPEIKGEDAKESQALTVEEQAEAFALLPEEHIDIFTFGAETGLRSGELCAARVSDINLRTETMMVQRTISVGQVRETTKGRHKNVIALSQEALRIAKRNMLGKDKSEFLFINPKKSSRYTINRLYQLWTGSRSEKFNDISVHELIRHSFCTQLMANTTIDAFAAMDVMRHKDIRMTNRYNHRNVELSRQHVNV